MRADEFEDIPFEGGEGEGEGMEDIPLLEPISSEMAEQYFQADVEHYIEEFKQKLEKDGRFQFPGDLEKAQMYGHAIHTGWSKVADRTAEDKEEFSGFYKSNNYFSLRAEPDEFGPMGVGYATYFHWFKMLIGILIIPFIFVCANLMWSHFSGSSCYTAEQLNRNRDLLQKVVKSNYTLSQAELDGLHEKEAKLFSKKPDTLSKYIHTVCSTKIGVEDCDEYHEHKCPIGGKLSPNCSQKVLELYLGRYTSSVCQKSITSVFTAGNIVDDPARKEDLTWKIIAPVALGLFLIMLFHVWHKSKDRFLNDEFLTLDDVSLRIVNIPKTKENPYKALRDALADYDPRYEPKKISLLFNTEYLDKLLDKLYQIQRSIVLAKLRKPEEGKSQEENKKLKGLEQKKSKVIEKITGCVQEFNSGKSRFFLGQAYVSFASTQTAQDAFHNFKKRFWRVFKGTHPLKIGDTPIFAEKSDHPLDIVWKNLHFTKWQRFWRTIVAFLISAVVFVFNLVLFFYVHIYVERYLEHKHGGFITKLLELTVSLVVFVAEEVLEHLMESLAEFQKPTTITKESASKAQRIWLICFANSGLLPLIVAFNLSNFFGQIGLVQNIHNYLLISMFLLPIIKPLKVIGLLFVQGWAESEAQKKLEEGSVSPILFQDSLNALNKPPAFKMSLAYASAMKVAAVAFFYMPIIPIAGVYLLITLALLYLTDKLVLVVYSNKLVSFSGYISKQLIGDLELLVALFLGGCLLKNFIMSLEHQESFHFINGTLIICLAIVICSYLKIFRIVSYFGIFRKISYLVISDPFKDKHVAEAQSDADDGDNEIRYEDVREHDPHEYYIVNPAKTFFHLHPELKQRNTVDSPLLQGGDDDA